MRSPIGIALENHPGEKVGGIRVITGRKNAEEVFAGRSQRSVISNVGPVCGGWRSRVGVGKQQSRAEHSRVRVCSLGKVRFPTIADDALVEHAHRTEGIDCNLRIHCICDAQDVRGPSLPTIGGSKHVYLFAVRAVAVTVGHVDTVAVTRIDCDANVACAEAVLPHLSGRQRQRWCQKPSCHAVARIGERRKRRGTGSPGIVAHDHHSRRATPVANKRGVNRSIKMRGRDFGKTILAGGITCLNHIERKSRRGNGGALGHVESGGASIGCHASVAIIKANIQFVQTSKIAERSDVRLINVSCSSVENRHHSPGEIVLSSQRGHRPSS